jgi:hypothetical protein
MYPFPVGFKYWANPSNPGEGFITWMVDDKSSLMDAL